MTIWLCCGAAFTWHVCLLDLLGFVVFWFWFWSSSLLNLGVFVLLAGGVSFEVAFYGKVWFGLRAWRVLLASLFGADFGCMSLVILWICMVQFFVRGCFGWWVWFDLCLRVA